MKLNSSMFNNWKEALDVLEKEQAGEIIVKYLKRRTVIEVTTEELFHDIRRYASVIIRKGLQGKHVGLFCNNSYELLVSLLALFYMGSVAALINKDISAEELEDYARRTDLDAIIFDDSTEETVLATTLDIVYFSLDKSEKEGVFSIPEEAKNEILDIRNESKLDDLILIMMTSGTTGKSKAVMHTNSTTMVGIISDFFYEDIKSALVVFPFHHVIGFGLAVNILMQGGTVCMGEGPATLFRGLSLMQAEFTYVVPAMMSLLCQKLNNKTQEELGWNLKLVGCGGAKVPDSYMEQIINHGIILRQSYGATETVGRGTIDRVSLDRPGMLGKPDPMVTVRIEDEELVIKSPTNSVGYYGDPETTAEVFVDGWYYTGDLARIDEEGYIYLTGRKKNLIILSNGENVSPEDIEGCFVNNFEIAEIMVRENNDAIEAVIYPEYQNCNTSEDQLLLKEKIRDIVEDYNDHAVSYKQINIVTFIEEPLPKNSSKKVIRY